MNQPDPHYEISQDNRKNTIEFYPDYSNRHCILARNGIKPYRRCDYCGLKTVNCLGIQNNVIALGIVALLLAFLVLTEPLLIRINIVLIGCLLVMLGFKINFNLDRLASSERENWKLNVALTRQMDSLEEQVKSRTHELEKIALYDGLTGLINRQEFERRLELAIEDAKENNTKHALCFLDLDRFKIVNDTCGHAAGDYLLKQLTPILLRHARETDTVSRFGGDEFAILLMDCNIDTAYKISENIRKSIEQFKFVWNETLYTGAASVGVIGINNKSQSEVEVLAGVDNACYMAKEQGRNRVQVYEHDAADLDRRHVETKWATRLQSALDNDRFVLYFQPIAALKKKNAPQKYEVLLRMRDHDDSIICPNVFLHAAERFNYMLKIDRWVISRSLESYVFLSQERPVELSINLSGESFSDEGLSDYIKYELRKTGANPENIIFEITETAAITNLDKALLLINSLKQIGCKFALDDFGSGLSSFNYLKNMPVDYLKIDGSFIRDILNNKSDMNIITAMNQISHTMGKETIAEYVESEKIMNKIKEIKIDYAQGSIVGKPMPLETLMESFGRKLYG